jgi:hypothetical protein
MKVGADNHLLSERLVLLSETKGHVSAILSVQATNLGKITRFTCMVCLP